MWIMFKHVQVKTPINSDHGHDIEVAGMMTHGVIVGIDDTEVMKQTVHILNLILVSELLRFY